MSPGKKNPAAGRRGEWSNWPKLPVDSGISAFPLSWQEWSGNEVGWLDPCL